MRWKLTLAYDGRAFAGWQIQPGATTVQETVEQALGHMLKLSPPPRIHASGRTDAGVHALGQTAHFDAPEGCRMLAGQWIRAFNANLPPAIRVLNCERVPEDFHARFSATGKTYRYRICNAPILPPLESGLAWHVPQKLDMNALQAAARCLVGRHDFAAFAAFRSADDERERTPGHAERTLWQALPERQNDILTLTFHGEGFLYKMARLLTGSLIRVARGKESLEWLQELLERPAGRKSPYAAPPDGLCLMQVDYPPEAKGSPLEAS